MQDSVIEWVGEHLHAQFGADPAATASLTFVGLGPIEVRCYPEMRRNPDTRGAAAKHPGRVVVSAAGTGPLIHFVSVGCARDPMSDPSAIVADPLRGPRAEVVVSLRPEGGIPPGLHKSVAVLAAAPAVEGVVLAADGIVDLAEPLWTGSGFTAVLLGESAIPDAVLEPPLEPVRFLDAIPITATEAAWVRVKGAAALRDAWSEAGIDPRDSHRRAVSL